MADDRHTADVHTATRLFKRSLDRGVAEFEYTDEEGQQSRRRVTGPVPKVNDHGEVYVTARDLDREDARNFAASRIRKVR